MSGARGRNSRSHGASLQPTTTTPNVLRLTATTARMALLVVLLAIACIHHASAATVGPFSTTLKASSNTASGLGPTCDAAAANAATQWDQTIVSGGSYTPGFAAYVSLFCAHACARVSCVCVVCARVCTFSTTLTPSSNTASGFGPTCDAAVANAATQWDQVSGGSDTPGFAAYVVCCVRTRRLAYVCAWCVRACVIFLHHPEGLHQPGLESCACVVCVRAHACARVCVCVAM